MSRKASVPFRCDECQAVKDVLGRYPTASAAGCQACNRNMVLMHYWRRELRKKDGSERLLSFVKRETQKLKLLLMLLDKEGRPPPDGR